MRLWSLSPEYLDSKGLVALWREGLLARHVLLGNTKGYTQHPQLERFKESKSPLMAIDAYLYTVLVEATRRGYNFDATKINVAAKHILIPVTDGQLNYEREHLANKLRVRDPEKLSTLPQTVTVHPLFIVMPGPVALWERP